MNKMSVWVIGGSELYEMMINSFSLNKIYVTEIYTEKGQEYDCDSFFPEIDMNNFSLTLVYPILTSKCRKTGKILYRFLVYENDDTISHSDYIWKSPEIQYLDALRDKRYRCQKCRSNRCRNIIKIWYAI